MGTLSGASVIRGKVPLFQTLLPGGQPPPPLNVLQKHSGHALPLLAPQVLVLCPSQHQAQQVHESLTSCSGKENWGKSVWFSFLHVYSFSLLNCILFSLRSLFLFFSLQMCSLLIMKKTGKCREEDGITVIPDISEIATVTILASSLSVPFLWMFFQF